MASPKKPRGRPPKYTNEEDQKAARRKTRQEAYQRKKASQQQQRQAQQQQEQQQQQQPQQQPAVPIGFEIHLDPLSILAQASPEGIGQITAPEQGIQADGLNIPADMEQQEFVEVNIGDVLYPNRFHNNS